ncbi:hypothetical protein [Actinomadura litoris]|uniref:hypothetical protein n=1 Tax=Actinomadura litoris TaxID=2678616 RepID=UPI001FA7CBDD|nr:hypothetical protein [Actinomadura litoris]
MAAEPRIWSLRAQRLLEKAVGEVRDNHGDPLETLSAATAALRIECGELPAAELEGYPFPGEDLEDAAECTCPADLRSRGGFRGGCPVHATC